MISKKQAKTLGIVLAIYLFFFLINTFSPLMGEDFALAAVIPGNSIVSTRELVTQLVNRVYNQMTNWNIRLGEQLSILFSCFPKIVFNIINSAVALVYFLLMNQWFFKGKVFPVKATRVLCFFGITILFQPALGEIFFWRTGSTSYLWSVCILLGISLPLRYYIGKERKDLIQNNWWKTLLLCVGAFLAGFTNENTVIFIVSLYMIVIMYDLIRWKKEKLWVVFSGASVMLGYIFLLNASSTKNRVEYYQRIFGISDRSIFELFLQIPNVAGSFFQNNWVLFSVSAGLVIVYLVQKAQEKPYIKWKNFCELDLENVGITILSALSVAALVASPYIEIRSYLLIDFMMIGCSIYYGEFFLEKFKHRRRVLEVIRIVKVVSLIILMVECVRIGVMYFDYGLFIKNRDEYMFSHPGEVVHWEIYHYGEEPCRELNTREDYLYLNPDLVEEYYNIVINAG